MPLISYNNNIPNPPNNPSNDAPLMQQNTNAIDTLLQRDHFSFNDNTAGGTHKQVTLTNQAAPGFVDGNGAVYANEINGNSWPIWQNSLGSFPLLSGATVNAVNGETSLAGGILLKWGFVANTSTAIQVTFLGVGLTDFPNNIWAIFLTPIKNPVQPFPPLPGSGQTGVAAITAGFQALTGFFIENNFNALSIPQIYWMAIGS